MKTLLTIDLDFWLDSYQKKETDKFFRKIRKMNVNIESVVYHHEILLNLKDNHFDKVINMDYHSDIANFNADNCSSKEFNRSFNEGTWVNYVEFRDKCDYIWLHSHSESSFCHGVCDPENDVLSDYATGWKSISHHARFPTDQELSEVTDIVICVSANWIYKSLIATRIYAIVCRMGVLSLKAIKSMCHSCDNHETKLMTNLGKSEKRILKLIQI